MAQWTLKQSLSCLIGSTVGTLTVALIGYRLYFQSVDKNLSDPKKAISILIQTGPEKEALKTAYLAELLDLSIDKPTNIHQFNLEEGQAKLCSSPLIAKAEIRKVLPNTLYIDYEVRKPVAWLGDYSNTAIDAEAYLFPVAPFFAPKELPEIYLGVPPFGQGEDFSGRRGGKWGEPMDNPYLVLALEILKYLEGSPWKEKLKVQRIDVSNAFAPSLGQREVVLLTEEELSMPHGEEILHCRFPKVLRLAPKEYPQQLLNFFALRKNMLEEYRRQIAITPRSGRFAPRIVDLRIPQLAFVEN